MRVRRRPFPAPGLSGASAVDGAPVFTGPLTPDDNHGSTGAERSPALVGGGRCGDVRRLTARPGGTGELPPRNTHGAACDVTVRDVAPTVAGQTWSPEAGSRLYILSLPHMSTRTNHVAVRFSAEEFIQVRARARASHTPLATFLRQTSLGHVPRTKQLTEYADLVRALNQVGIALDAREGGDVERALAELRDVLARSERSVGTRPPVTPRCGRGRARANTHRTRS